MKKLLLLVVLLLAGCANGFNSYVPEQPKTVTTNTEKILVGVPVLLGLEGSTARLDDEWMITSAHNRPILSLQGVEFYQNPSFDVLIYKEKGRMTTKVGLVYQGQEVTHLGYPQGRPLAANNGTYIGEVVVVTWNDMKASATTGVVAQGMSGGGVYNQKGELVGVNQGYVTGTVTWDGVGSFDDPAVFVSLLAVREWLEDITGNDYFPKYTE